MRKKAPIQYFNADYIDRCRDLNPDQILEFLDDFQTLMSETPQKCQPISIKIEPALLRAFKMKAKLAGIPYQTQIKKLMKAWIQGA